MGSKNELLEEYGQLEMQLLKLKERYDDICSSVVQRASAEYLRCKNHFILRRKNEVKSIIEGCIKVSVLQKFPQYSDDEQDKGETPRKGLLTVARQFSCTMGDVQAVLEIKHKVRHMKKADLQREIEKTKTELSEMNKKFEKLLEEITTLEGDYKASSHIRIFYRRYLERKSMIKTFIRDSTQ
ncbi:uncharacterized protein LOC123534755 [Mercenaria mercenaria]|uniref:uncharacterized protein LOC123534755 n=1 Tax=Mercenaria mercenaria TaxID=6596 RepID=UPI00234F0AD9|nr:uncharacterized protein LOC123534755 [Mercenaria mercenaria]